MSELLKFQTSLPENRERSPAKIAQINLFKDSNTSRSYELAPPSRGNKSAIFGDNVKAEQTRVRNQKKDSDLTKGLDMSEITQHLDQKITKLE